MQLFESYEFISRAVVALVLLALLIFYIISLRLTVKRQVRIIKSASAIAESFRSFGFG